MKDKVTSIGYEPLRELYEYWCQLRGDGISHQRVDLRPENLKPWLGHVSLHDVLDSGKRFRVRLQGTEVTEMFPYGLTGKYLDETAPSEELPYVEESFKALIKTQKPHHILLQKKYHSTNCWQPH